MPFRGGISDLRSAVLTEIEAPCLDLSGSGLPGGLLSKLQRQNKALDKLRIALDDEDEIGVAGCQPVLLHETA